jgi:hypothetical protein
MRINTLLWIGQSLVLNVKSNFFDHIGSYSMLSGLPNIFCKLAIFFWGFGCFWQQEKKENKKHFLPC